MKKFIYIISALCFGLFISGCYSPADKISRDLRKICGNWKITSMVFTGIKYGTFSTIVTYTNDNPGSVYIGRSDSYSNTFSLVYSKFSKIKVPSLQNPTSFEGSFYESNIYLAKADEYTVKDKAFFIDGYSVTISSFSKHTIKIRAKKSTSEYATLTLEK